MDGGATIANVYRFEDGMNQDVNVLTSLVRDILVVAVVTSAIVVVLALATDVNWRGFLVGQIVFVFAYGIIRYLRLTKRIRW